MLKMKFTNEPSDNPYIVRAIGVPPCLTTKFIKRTYWRSGKSTQISVSVVVAGTPCKMAAAMPTI